MITMFRGWKDRILKKLPLLAFAAALLISAVPVSAPTAFAEAETVRVGYYENEVFQEGAAEGEVKTGYAYEYYRKLSEYTGWHYEYVYGSYGDLYQMLLGRGDRPAGGTGLEGRARGPDRLSGRAHGE